MEELRMLLDLLISAALGCLIGFERKMRAKEAGMRTHTLVCTASALMMVISKYAFGDLADPARVAAQIIPGIGFLGAGIIVYRKHEVHGLTTAAGVWATAGVGMACGARMYILSAGATAILVGTQWILHRRWKLFQAKKAYMLKIVFTGVDGEREKVKELFHIERYTRLFIERKEGKVYYQATLHTERDYPSTELDKILRENEFVVSVERCDDN